MRALLDVNVLIALLDTAHPHHGLAADWLKASIRHGWASCPITQNGCIRIMSQPSYPGSRPVTEIVERLRGGLAHRAHEFWPDSVSLLDAELVDSARVHGARQVTDTYLLALAVRRQGRFVTFDAGVAVSAVVQAEPRHLITLV